MDAELIPVKMAVEYAYCPRLFYLMFADERWEENFYTEHGLAVHSRLDAAERGADAEIGAGIRAGKSAKSADVVAAQRRRSSRRAVSANAKFNRAT